MQRPGRDNLHPVRIVYCCVCSRSKETSAVLDGGRLLPSTSVRCAAAIFPQLEMDRAARGHRENGAHDQFPTPGDRKAMSPALTRPDAEQADFSPVVR